ncbi:MAG: M14 family zinc carboxypeptidase [Chloroflexota bacterium]
MITVEAVEDGGNPRDPAAIQRLGDAAHFRIVPFSEDGDANYKFALHVLARNTGPSPAPLTLEIDWGDQAYMVSRGFLHVRRAGRWEFLPVMVDGSLGRLMIVLPPGESAIGLSPAYGLADRAAFLAQPALTSVRRDVIGYSEQGRPIESFSFGTGPRRLLVTARFHPYETAASWCIEGLLSWLTARSEAQEQLLRQTSVDVVPMPNPDGVVLGLCKRTGLGGTDLSHEAGKSDDATARVLLDLLDTLRPAAFLDIHGWMHFDEDGLHHYDDGLAARFQHAAAGDQALIGNRWKAYLERPCAGSPLWYSTQRYGTLALAVSYRWPGRTLAQMQAIGTGTLRAFTAAIS